MYHKVKDVPGLARDMNSGAIVNTDVEAYNAFMKKRKQEEEHNSMMVQIQKMENDIGDIKKMLSSLVASNK